MRQELEVAVCGLLDNTEVDLRNLTDVEADRIADMASLTVRCRSVVDRDPRTNEIVNLSPAELPARFAKQLGRLYVGLLAIGAPDAWEVVVRCALDSMPANRRAALEVLAGEDDAVPTRKVSAAVGLPVSTVRRTLQDLAAHGAVVMEHEPRGRDEVETWALTDWSRGLWPTSPDLSVPDSPIEGWWGPSNDPCPISDDFSGPGLPASRDGRTWSVRPGVTAGASRTSSRRSRALAFVRASSSSSLRQWQQPDFPPSTTFRTSCSG